MRRFSILLTAAAIGVLTAGSAQAQLLGGRAGAVGGVAGGVTGTVSGASHIPDATTTASGDASSATDARKAGRDTSVTTKGHAKAGAKTAGVSGSAADTTSAGKNGVDETAGATAAGAAASTTTPGDGH